MTRGERAIVGRAAALAILAVALIAVWLGPVDAYFGVVADGAARIETATALLQRYRAATDPDAAAAMPVSPGAGLLLPAMPEAQAAALLQETIKGAAAAAQVEIRGMQVLRGDPLSGAGGIGIRVSASGDLGGLSRLLYAIEAARPLLYPDNLEVRSAAAPGQAPARLEFQLDVSGSRSGGT
jgi:general secretion pathway protein M